MKDSETFSLGDYLNQFDLPIKNKTHSESQHQEFPSFKHSWLFRLIQNKLSQISTPKNKDDVLFSDQEDESIPNLLLKNLEASKENQIQDKNRESELTRAIEHNFLRVNRKGVQATSKISRNSKDQPERKEKQTPKRKSKKKKKESTGREKLGSISRPAFIRKVKKILGEDAFLGVKGDHYHFRSRITPRPYALPYCGYELSDPFIRERLKHLGISTNEYRAIK